MDDNKDKVDDPLLPGAEFPGAGAESSWSLGGDDESDNVYFFGTGSNRDTGILTEFGWNFQPAGDRDGGGGFDRIEKDLAGNISTTNTPSVPESTSTATEPTTAAAGKITDEPVSSSCSDDPPEKSTASGGSSASRPPSDTA